MSRTARVAWIGVGSVVTVVALLFGTAQVVADVSRERTTEVDVFPAEAIDALELRTSNGSIEITGADVDEITVRADITSSVWRTGRRTEVDGRLLRIESSCPPFGLWCGVHYRIEVPNDLDVEAHDHNGRITLRNLSGRVEATTDNGSVTATELTSTDVTASSHNGRVRLEFTEPPTDVRATTDNGRVEVVVPDTDDAYRVDVHTDNGPTEVGVRSDPSSDRSIVARTSNGGATVRYPTD